VLLPGGTPLTVDNTSPVNGDEFNVPGTTIDITDAGQATIGAGVPITLAYSVDRSGSMGANAGVDCTGDAVSDTRMVCAQEGVAAANDTAADSLSPIELTGLASFADGGSTHDVDLGTAGVQLLVAPDHDGDSNGTPDLEDAVFPGIKRGHELCGRTGQRFHGPERREQHEHQQPAALPVRRRQPVGDGRGERQHAGRFRASRDDHPYDRARRRASLRVRRWNRQPQ
jgi:hypothetical protein